MTTTRAALVGALGGTVLSAFVLGSVVGLHNRTPLEKTVVIPAPPITISSPRLVLVSPEYAAVVDRETRLALLREGLTYACAPTLLRRVP